MDATELLHGVDTCGGHSKVAVYKCHIRPVRLSVRGLIGMAKATPRGMGFGQL